MAQRDLSKSKLIAFRQCPKRLWLELHQPQLREDSKSTQAIFKTGHEVGAMAQRLYDPAGQAEIINLHAEGVGPAIERTKSLMQGDAPIFEAGFAGGGAMAFADVMLPVVKDGRAAWRMVEVKSSASVKDYYLDDIAIQSFVAREAGVRLAGVSIAHIDSRWTYPGGGNYEGLLTENDLTDVAFPRAEEVRGWIRAAHAVSAQSTPPAVAMGLQCVTPFSCGFEAHCSKDTNPAEFPVTWLPRIQSSLLKKYIRQHMVIDMRDVPDELLNPLQRRVRAHTIAGRCFFDSDGAKLDLHAHSPPAYFLDFETVQFGIPRWAGTRPFQSLPFQFSLHFLNAKGELTHHTFLDLSGADPSLAFARALIEKSCEIGPIFVYNSGFEGSRIQELSMRFPELEVPLLSIRKRLFDLLPIAQSRFYHPSQMGSWSLKKLLPAIAPHWRYEHLAGVQDGNMATQAFLEAIDPTTSHERRQQIEHQLHRYCAMDTMAIVEIWRRFSGYP